MEGRIIADYATVHRDDFIPLWERLGAAVHRFDCKYIMQLSHSAGRWIFRACTIPTKRFRKAMNPFDKGQQQLGGWHPRQQRMSGDTISQWMQRCVDADIIRRPAGPYGREQTHSLGTRVATERLFEAYAADCKPRGVRAVNYQEFGRACTQVFGVVQKCNAEFNHDEWGYPKGPGRRPHGYDVPTAEVWQERLDARLGIPGKNLQNRN
jgi:hypothetical protein